MFVPILEMEQDINKILIQELKENGCEHLIQETIAKFRFSKIVIVESAIRNNPNQTPTPETISDSHIVRSYYIDNDTQDGLLILQIKITATRQIGVLFKLSDYNQELKKLNKITEHYFKIGKDFFCEFVEQLKCFSLQEIEELITKTIHEIEDEKIILTKDETKKYILMRIDYLKQLVIKEFETNEIWK